MVLDQDLYWGHLQMCNQKTQPSRISGPREGSSGVTNGWDGRNNVAETSLSSEAETC